MKKATHAGEVTCWQQIPNIGPAMMRDFAMLGLVRPQDLAEQDAWALYQRICAVTGQRHDPCVLDTYMAAIDFMQGAPARPWWAYTQQRKALFPNVEPLTPPAAMPAPPAR